MIFVRQCYSPLAIAIARQASQHSIFRAGGRAIAVKQILSFSSSSVSKDEQKKESTSHRNHVKLEPVLHENGHNTSEGRSLHDKPKATVSGPQRLDDIKNLPSDQESQRSEISKWMVERLDKLQTTIFTAGQTLNDFTGYSSIEKIKKSIEEQGMLHRFFKREC